MNPLNWSSLASSIRSSLYEAEGKPIKTWRFDMSYGLDPFLTSFSKKRIYWNEPRNMCWHGYGNNWHWKLTLLYFIEFRLPYESPLLIVNLHTVRLTGCLARTVWLPNGDWDKGKQPAGITHGVSIFHFWCTVDLSDFAIQMWAFVGFASHFEPYILLLITRQNGLAPTKKSQRMCGNPGCHEMTGQTAAQ